MTGERLRGLPYIELRRLRRAGLIPPAAGPCDIAGCHALKQPGWPPIPQDRFVYDHCHMHGLVRGVVCVNCNQLLAVLDSGRWHHDGFPAGIAMYPPRPAYQAHQARCPKCRASRSTDPRCSHQPPASAPTLSA